MLLLVVYENNLSVVMVFECTCFLCFSFYVSLHSDVRNVVVMSYYVSLVLSSVLFTCDVL